MIIFVFLYFTPMEFRIFINFHHCLLLGGEMVNRFDLMYIDWLFIAYSLFNSTIHKKRQNGNPQNLN